jgi:hypothetical protein
MGEAVAIGVRGLPRKSKSTPSESNAAGRLVWRLVELLELGPDHLLVGLGAGASPHCHAMLELVSLRHQMVLVDPQPNRLARLANEPSMRLVAMSALEFARFPIQWDRILLDDALAAEDGEGELLPLLFARLRTGGRMVVALPATALPPSAALQRAMGFARRVSDSGFEVIFDSV